MTTSTKQAYILALDTSTAALAAALVPADGGGEPAAELQLLSERNHSIYVVPKLKELLETAGLTAEALDCIAVGQGPGSYTGVRIGVTVGKTLAWAWDKPIIGVSSLEAHAYGAWTEGAAADTLSESNLWIVPAMDARRGQVYTSLFAAGGVELTSWTRLAEDGIRLMSDWVGELLGRLDQTDDAKPVSMLLVGDLSQHAAETERLRAQLEVRGIELKAYDLSMQGRWIGKLAAAQITKNGYADLHSFVPNYTQLAEAEAKLIAKRDGE